MSDVAEQTKAESLNTLEEKHKKGFSLKFIAWILTGLGFVMSIFLVASIASLSNTYKQMSDSTLAYINWKDTALAVQHGSDELTDQVRMYVITEKSEYMDGYFAESKSGRRQKALEQIKESLDGTPVYTQLQISLNESMQLMEREYYAMRLMIDVTGRDISDTKIPEEVRSVNYKEEDAIKTVEAKKELAIDYVFGDEYIASKVIIIGGVDSAVNTLDDMMENDVINTSKNLNRIIIFQSILVGMNVIFVSISIVLLLLYVVRPINVLIADLENDDYAIVKGAKEYKYLAKTYNKIRRQNIEAKQNLTFHAEHDRLTGLLNRTGYENIFSRVNLGKCLFVLIDIDKFKDVNDAYGHAAGDKVLKKVADLLQKYFSKSNEYISRIGGDEFTVIIDGIEEEEAETIKTICHQVNKELVTSKKGIQISLSIGMAFGSDLDTTDTLFKKADIALYATKENGRSNVTLYSKSISEKK
ncbi:MAG: GGDEF domain-containing protein [Bacilli bacterium]|nr:GGDEF domain-containing protein [Bacilli bacterium]